ncbi:sugar phosphate isomerase/epimerase family protein [Yersinia alsatica]|uniref:Sugar phosphate isomerase/epimerase n=1 Tax=Yersinia alsatica TaxID=2890317 RepID=A0ABY5US60_9GAMM|nr:TIM barrel protein [Yersinia alsatica]OWF69781.1 xylose isomerase [Yersinia frederiksenii]UWM46311.1 sugar phosphate isomerase/epimerase [Yersinia alsatica]CNK46469.1 Hydroxypyruvate isomerase [Yersinia frederiksenii]CNL26443.1 Hydroxypyruvate isomerase [Yersinia frederiksenii]
MRLAISNIAWDIVEDDSVASLLEKYEINAIDIAPGKYFSDPKRASKDDILKVKTWWETRGFTITGMQALLFGTTGLNMFGPTQVQHAMLTHLESICRIGSILGANRLVFGSPRNRDCFGLTEQETHNKAIDFFRKLGNIAQLQNVIICLEPNPTCYGANFMTSTLETAKMVELVDHKAIKMQLDIGAITINKENIAEILPSIAHLIGHVHISEPDLLPIGDLNTSHAYISNSLKKYLPNHVASIEMLATKQETHIVSIERAIKVAINNYLVD